MNNQDAIILIVDDKLQNRKLLKVLLKPEGYRIFTVASGKEALAFIARTPPHLILLDVMMPEMDGYTLAKILKADIGTINIPIIMVSAQDDYNARLAGLDAGAEDYLTTPVDRAELWLRVRNLLRLKNYSDFLQNHSTVLEQEVQSRAADLHRFRAAMDVTVDAIFLLNRTSMRFVEINATACKMFGYSREELLQINPVLLDMRPLQQLEDSCDAVISNQHPDALTETKMLRKDGVWMEVDVRQHAHKVGGDWILVNVVRDITERKEAEKRLHRMAHYDALTGLPNRLLFYETLEKTLNHSIENNYQVAVLFLDLDHFKNINDTLGHAVGDELLCQFSDRMLECVRIRDTIGRLGGDEFAMILMAEDGLQGALLVVNKVREVLQAPFKLKGGYEVAVSVSIGITVSPNDASNPDVLIKYADTAMYRAKKAGRDTYRFFTAQMNTDVLIRLDLENALRKAIENNEFVLFYQPKVQLNSGLIVGFEALLRWQRPGVGLVSPNDFVPVLEETGLIVRVGSWVIATACTQIALWLASPIGPMQISVNVAGRQFIEGDLEGDVEKALSENAIPAELLELELTEGSLMENTTRTITILQNLGERGVQISIDDFGTGYSSLAYLRRFPLDKLKIDIAFIRDIMTNPDAASIALAIIGMAHNLKLEVIAEGVETAAQLAYLQLHKCDQIQGYYFSPPLPVAELEKMLYEKKRLLQDTNQAFMQKTLLLIDEDADELLVLQKLLYEEGYQILIGRSINEALQLLALHPIQVILCDQTLLSKNGIDFLDQVKDLYPSVVRIVNSTHTDLEIMINAIYSGAIFRFNTKPRNEAHVRDHIRDAFQQYRLARNSV